MSIFFSRQCEYAIQAIIYLALKPYGEMTSIRELTKQLEIPYHFLAKILQDLAHKGLLKSHKGPSGGFTLTRPAEEVTPFEIIEAIDGHAFLNDCIMGFKECTPEHACALHEQWQASRQGIASMLTSKHISDFVEAMKKLEYMSGAHDNPRLPTGLSGAVSDVHALDVQTDPRR